MIALAGLVLVASSGAAPPPEFRSSDLPAPVIHRTQAQAFRTDVVELTLAPKSQSGSRLEYKVHMQAGDALLYVLTASRPVIAEFHGESDANKAVMFYSEEKSASTSHGQFVAPMKGVHGWYLANEQAATVTVQLRLIGYYEPTPGLIKIK